MPDEDNNFNGSLVLDLRKMSHASQEFKPWNIKSLGRNQSITKVKSNHIN